MEHDIYQPTGPTGPGSGYVPREDKYVKSNGYDEEIRLFVHLASTYPNGDARLDTLRDLIHIAIEVKDMQEVEEERCPFCLENGYGYTTLRHMPHRDDCLWLLAHTIHMTPYWGDI